ncbi:MAG: hypothetical protein AAF985_25350, partial [Bacteroidota bacterium]
FVIPMMIYLLMCFERQPSIRSSLLIAGAILLAYGLHFYLFALSILMIGFYWLMKLLRQLSLEHFKKVLLYGGVQTLLPFIILLVFFVINDPITDRPMKPYGFKAYRAYLLSVFFPLDFYPGTLLKSWLGPMKHIKGEGLSYVGLVATGFVFVVGLRRLWQWRSGRLFASADEQFRPFLLHLFGAGLILLFLSLGLPFVVQGLEFLLDYTGPLKQFRSMGRFAWVFFYIVNIIAFYLAYRWSRGIDRKGLRLAFLLLLIGILNLEAMVSLFKPKYKLYPHPSIRHHYRAIDTPWLKTIDWTQYQAILPVPYFHIGSENIWVRAESPVLPRSMWTSVQTGLPILSSFMGRTSLSQTLEFMALVKEPYQPLPILEKMDPEKSILIFLQKGNYESKKEQYEFLLEDLPPIYEDKLIVLYELKPAILRQRIDDRAVEAHAAFDTLALVQHQEYWSTDSLANAINLTFDHHALERNYAGGGAFAGAEKIEHIVYEGHLPKQKPNVPYICSVWAYVQEDLQARTWFNIEEYDRSSGKRLWKKGYKLDQQIQAIDGEWALIEIPFQLRKADSGVRITAINHDLFKKQIHLDELMLRPSDSSIFRKEKEGFWLNNRRYKNQ